MTLDELQKQVLELSPEDRWQLIDVLTRSLQTSSIIKPKGLAVSLIGIAKTEIAPTDQEVEAMLDQRLARKYL